MDDLWIVIPAYKPDEKCMETIKELILSGYQQILLVNDGSGPDYDEFFEKAKLLPAVTVLRHAVNQGKGRALKTAFHYLLNEVPSAKLAITVDADGQHLVADIASVAETARSLPNHIVLGVRDFKKKDIPLRSSFGNRMTRNVFRISTGIPLSDTQTGLRAFHREQLPWLLSIPGEKFDFEMNMLVHLKDTVIQIAEVPIETVYIEENESSHFQPIKDSMNIYKVFLRFSISGILSFALDIGLFHLFIELWEEEAPKFYITLATVFARIISSLFNYALNRHVVFKDGSEASFWRYVVLVLLVMAASSGLVSLVHFVSGVHETMVKVIIDLLLFVIGFYLQKVWVFRK